MIATSYRLVCDDCGAESPPHHVHDEVREGLSHFGWKNIDSRDLCFSCARKHGV